MSEDAGQLELLPAVDIAGGRAAQVVDQAQDRDPWTVASSWQEQGAQWVHLVDLDQAFGRGSNQRLLADIVDRLDVPVQLSGGVRDSETLQRALATGCRRVNLATQALADPDWVLQAVAEHGDRVAVGIDVRGSVLAARGACADAPGLGDVWQMLERLEAHGCPRYVVTDVSRDGRRTGPNTELLRRVCELVQAPVVSSGGIGGLQDLAALRALVPRGVEGTIVGAALYHGAFTLTEALQVAASAS